MAEKWAVVMAWSLVAHWAVQLVQPQADMRAGVTAGRRAGWKDVCWADSLEENLVETSAVDLVEHSVATRAAQKV